MKRLLLLFYFSILLGQQFDDPADFKFSIKDVRKGEIALLNLDTDLEFGWHIYAIYDVPDGPESTTINVKGSIIDDIGMVIEPVPIISFDEGFGLQQDITKKSQILKSQLKFVKIFL
jgi:thiol:disulfide interchange protein DsbD